MEFAKKKKQKTKNKKQIRERQLKKLVQHMQESIETSQKKK